MPAGSALPPRNDPTDRCLERPLRAARRRRRALTARERPAAPPVDAAPRTRYNPFVTTLLRPGRLPKLELLLDQVRAYRPDADVALLQRAFAFASQAHQGQTRLSGHPYISHPFEVARILAELELDDTTIAAGLLHDVIEDRPDSADRGRAEFGDEIADLVEGVSKLSQIDFRSQEEKQVQNLRKMLLAMAKDLRVILIKLADRVHNMRTLKPLSQTRQQAIARETLQVFAPIAHRLGVWRIKWELEDLALKHLDPDAYQQIARKVARSRSQRERTIRTATKQLRERLEAAGIEAEIEGRPKHFYSIYEKMQRQSVDFSQILDLQAMRVVVGTVEECYAVLGHVHRLWLPLPDMFTDYIAKPKTNLYQAIHTKVFGPNGEPLEVQIRTRDMHRTAEYGVASHWRYKEGDARDAEFDRKLTWLRQFLDYQADLKDPGEWLESLKIDLFKDQVFVFTPKGDVLDLPAGSTPVDFAYRIHTEVGHHCSGARVNGKMVPLTYVFRNGDVAEILTSRNARPSLDWLSFVATSQAKGRIRSWYRKQRRGQNVTQGRQALEASCRRHGLKPAEFLRAERLQPVAAKLNHPSVEDLLAAIGFGDVPAETVIHRLAEAEGQAPIALKRPAPKPGGQGALRVGVSARGAENLLIRLSRCCAPIPGDPIVGFITRGRGVAVHRADCPNIGRLRQADPDRIVEVDWTLSEEAFYTAGIRIEALDRVGLLSDVLAVTTAQHINIRDARVLTDPKNKTASIVLSLDITGLPQLRAVIADLDRISDVLSVQRIRSA